ncbi:5-aminolevulinate synthase [Apiospora rasikravindrae]|uniref:5-aminolevulinate synthase n=1 Tax=Apiospora rasikravindrae TaxID=990691 RepID=A0ABR1UCU8_9PEZI
MAPSAAQGIDPWEWDTNRVVKELCTSKRSWKSFEDPPILPDPTRLENALRDNLINGISLLKDADDECFFKDIGVKANKHKNTLRDAISQFRRRSRRYKKYLVEREQEDEVEDEVMSDNDDDELEDIETRKRKLQAERMSQASEDQVILPLDPVGLPVPLTERATAAATAATIPDPNSPKENSHAKGIFSNDASSRKKRRVEPLQVLDHPLGRASQVIPTQADDVIEQLIRKGKLQENPFLKAPVMDVAMPTSGQSVNDGSWYLGRDSLTRVDVIDFDSSRLTDADMTFVIRKQFPVGRRRQVSRLYKRQIQRQTQRQVQLERRRQGLAPLPNYRPDRPPAKADTVFGANDPDHGEVLPLLGESDSGDEYDSDTWAEIEAEEKERVEAMAKANTALSADDVNMAIDEGINEYVAAWTDRKLPKLERSANTKWNKARRSGLKRALDSARKQISYLQKRLDAMRARLTSQEWRNKADIKSSMGNIEPTVQDLQESLWMLDVLKSPSEPKRVSNVTRKPAKKREQRPRPQVNDDEGELLMSDSEDDFIVEDDEQDHASLPEEILPQDEMAIDFEHEAIGDDPTPELSGAESVAIANAGPCTPLNGRDSEAQDIVPAHVAGNSEMEKPSRSTPSIFDVLGKQAGTRNGDDLDEVTDLTQAAQSPAPFRPTISRPPETPRRSSYPPGCRGSCHARKAVTELKEPKPIITTSFNPQVKNTLKELPLEYRESIFGICKLYTERRENEVDLWEDYIIPHLGHQWTSPPFDPKDEKKDDDQHKKGEAPRLRKYWQVSDEMKRNLRSRKRQFREFMDFYCKLVKELRQSSSRNNTPSSTPVDRSASTKSKAPNPRQLEEPEVISEDTDDDETEGEPAVSPAKKRRPIQRDRAAQNLRDSDRARVKEQAKRRELLRAKLAAQGHSEASQNSHLLINESKEDDQGFIYVPDNIASRIKKHQVEGVRFMWNQLVADSQSRQGCLLAHTMGLGKTMQIITLLVTIANAAASDDPSISGQIPDELKESRTLILAPPGLINNWTDELLIWIPDGHPILGDKSENLYKIDADTTLPDRHNQIVDWADFGGILVIGYTLFKTCAQNTLLAGHLFDEANIVVADEAHMLKNETSQLHNAAVRFRTRTRIALTGSPLANNVKEYHSMLNWVCPGYLSSKKEFDHDYARPIEEGLSVDSSRAQKRKALTKLRALKQTVAPKVHRRTIAVLHHDVPPKMEFVISVPLTKLQRALYETYIKFNQTDDKGSMKLLASATTLTVLCNHPDAFRALLKEQKDHGSAKDGPDETERINLPPVLVSELLQMMSAGDLKEAAYSSKMLILDRILDESKAKGDKVLIFSQSMKTLDYLEKILRSRRRHYLRLDGKTQASKRPGMVRDFNAVESTYEVFLISTTAGGLGLNITSANRVVIMDSKWNPQQEQQAVGRAFRIGQTKPVFVYRLVCGGTLEMKLHHRQIFKMQLAQRVVDDQKPIPKAQRLAELFNMPSDPEPGEVMEHLGKDAVLDGILESELGSHVKSIVMTDTFEEEALEEETLAQEEEVEAQRLINEFHARQGRPLATGFDFAASLAAGMGQPQHVSTFAAPGAQQAGLTMVNSFQALPGGIRSTAPAPAAVSRSVVANGTSHSPGHSQLLHQSASPPLPVPAVQQVSGGGSIAPVPGATTQLRQANVYWDNIQAFKGELGRVFSTKGTGGDAARCRAVAHTVAAAFEQQQNQRQLQGIREAKWAVMDSSQASSRFVDAIVAGLLPPIKLAQMEAGEIVAKRKTWDSLPQASWDHEISTHRHKIDTTVNPGQGQSSSSSGQPANIHRQNDQIALEEFRAQKSGQTSIGQISSRLPPWAKTVTGSQRDGSSSAPRKRNAKNPFQ